MLSEITSVQTDTIHMPHRALVLKMITKTINIFSNKIALEEGLPIVKFNKQKH